MTLSIVLAALWQVAPVNGAPGLLRDGKPVSPILFWQRDHALCMPKATAALLKLEAPPQHIHRRRPDKSGDKEVRRSAVDL